jgi:hypothetical protein
MSNQYKLTSSELQFFIVINQNALAVKARIHDLNMELEKAQAQRDMLESQAGGAMSMLAHAHQLRAPVQLSSDFTILTGVQNDSTE